jgi:hypothetical protein
MACTNSICAAAAVRTRSDKYAAQEAEWTAGDQPPALRRASSVEATRRARSLGRMDRSRSRSEEIA